MLIDLKKPIPLYLQIVDHIKSLIESGELKPDQQIESQQLLAKKYKVSLITVKRALNDLTKEKYIYSHIGKGTYVASRDKKSSQSEQKNIGLILRDLNSPYFSGIIEPVENQVSELGFNLLIATSSNDPQKEDRQIQKFLDMGVAGIILGMTTQRFNATELILKMHKEHFPYVIISFVDNDSLNYISTDHRYGAFLATEHLISLGYEKIGYINNEKGYPLGEVRKSGYLDALRKYNLDFNPDFEFRIRERGEQHYFDSGYQVGQKFYNLADMPDAMFVYNDLTALGFQRYLLEKGVRIPEDVAIVGFDNIKRGQVAPVTLTTIEQPLARIGKKAVNSIIEITEGIAIKWPVILKPRLVVRQSTAQKMPVETPL